MPNESKAIRYDGKVAVITGGASGIGRATAVAFVAAGASVAVGDINADGLASLERELGQHCTTLLTDVSHEAQVEALVCHCVKTFGCIDIGVNCAGAATPKPILEIDETEWDQNLALNLKGLFLALKHEAKVMRSQGKGGVIINITSVTASLCPVGLSHYSSAKAGANQLTRIAAEEFQDLGIRVVAVAPGLVRTPLAQTMWDTPGLLDAYNSNVPSNRGGEAHEIADAVLFLASDRANFINGTVTYLDGGHSANGGWADFANIREYYK
jgi:NAD(P)-dependent dehydrogenase (short-subunit alcohol dehydrogenase family)